MLIYVNLCMELIDFWGVMGRKFQIFPYFWVIPPFPWRKSDHGIRSMDWKFFTNPGFIPNFHREFFSNFILSSMTELLKFPISQFFFQRLTSKSGAPQTEQEKSTLGTRVEFGSGRNSRDKTNSVIKTELKIPGIPSYPKISGNSGNIP